MSSPKQLSLLSSALKQTQVNAVCPPQLKTLSTEMTTYQALETLTRQYKFLSAPLLSPEGQAVGILSVMNLVEYFVGSLEMISDDEEQSFFEQQARFATVSKKKLGVILDKIKLDKYVAVESQSYLAEAAQHFSQGVHRAAVVDSKNQILVSVLTQSALVRFVSQQPNYLGSLKQKQIKDFPNLGTRKVISVHKDIKAYEAFKIMMQHGISGLPILDDQKKLIGNISNSNLNEVKPNNIFSLLQLPVSQYVNRIRQQNKGNIGHPVIGIMETSRLDLSLMKLVGTKVHRIYVVSQDHHISRVITLRDVIRFLSSTTYTEE